MSSIDLGSVTAYSIAVKYGFEGTEAEWMQAIINAGEYSQETAENAELAAASAQSAEASAVRAEILYGSPLIANTVADMVEENRVYVYVGSETGYTSGNWYYYDGTTWESGGVYNGEGVNTDTTLSVEGMPADAKAVGDELADVKSDLAELEGSGLSDDAKQALLACFQNVAWIGTDGDDYYQDLYDALYPPAPPATLTSITCVYTQSGTVYDTDTLDSLKSDLVVTAHYDDQTTSTVTAYTLSGTLTEGTSTITVSYNGKTTTFTVTVSHAIDPSEDWEDGVAYTYTLVENEYVGADGSFVAYNGWSRTPYLPCKGASKITGTASNWGSGYYARFYDTSKTPIGDKVRFAGDSTVPSDAAYFVASQSNAIMQGYTSIVPNA